MTQINITVRGAAAKSEKTGLLTSGMVGLPVTFTFDDSWNGLVATAVFSGSGVTKSVPLLGATETVVPWEVMVEPHTILRIGAEGRLTDGTLVIPTTWATVGTLIPGANATDDLAKPPTPTAYDRIMSLIGNMADLNTEDKDSLVAAINSLYSNGTVVTANADYAEVGEWSDGNPDGEDRTGYFVSVDTSEPGKTMIKSTSTSDVRGVTMANPGFSANASKDKYDSEGNLLPQYAYVGFAGFVPVIDNGTCEVNGRCMPADDGTAVPSANNMGYQVIDRIDDTHVLVLVEPQADMMVRIKEDVIALNNNKLSTNALPGAIKTALEQAKESGEFDGSDGKSAYKYAVDGGYTGTEAEFAEKLAEEMPDKLPNPSALTFTGAVTGRYDGSSPLTVDIPSGGGGSGGAGKAKTQKLIDITFTEPTASLTVTLEHNFHKLFLVWSSGDTARLVDADGNAVSGSLGILLGTTSFSWNNRKIGQLGAETTTWKTSALLIEYTDDLTTLLSSRTVDITTGTSGNTYNQFGGTTAMIGTIGNNALAPTVGRTVNIVTSGGFFAATTRIVLVGEYYE